MASLANVNIKFTADLKGFSSQMQNVNRQMQKVGKNLQKIGAQLSVGVTAPFIAFSALSLKNWDKQVKAIAQVETGLRTTGNAVGFTSNELQKMASSLQSNTLFGDEEILQNVTAQLLTFTNIAGQQFDRTQQAALDLATRLDGDLKSASIQLGKALNDPVANLSALSRSGIQFSEEQKSTINTLVETNRLAEAQTIILNELEKQYGGSAAAAAKAGTGPLTQLKNSIGDLSEEFGAIIAEAIIPFVETIKGLVSGFQNLSPETKKFIVILGGVAAAVGPLLALAGTILPAISTGFTLLTGPIGLVVAGLTAIGVIVYKNWSPIREVLVDIANYFIDLYNESSLFRAGVESVVLVFRNMWSVAKFAFSSISSLVKGFIASFVSRFKLIGRIFKAVFTGSFKEIPKIVSKYKDETRKGVSGVGESLKEDWSKLMSDVGNNTKKAFENVGNRSKIKLLKSNIDTTEIIEKVNEISPLNIPVKLGVNGSKNKVRGVLDDKRNGEGKIAQIPDLGIVEGVKQEREELETELRSVNDSFIDFSTEISDTISVASASVLENFGVMIAGLFDGSVSMGDVAGLLLKTVGDIAVQLGKAAIKIGVGMLAIKAAFTNPFTAIAAGVALVAIGSLIGSIATNFSGGDGGSSPRPFANGGIVYGPTNALIGEYAGASNNPEVVAPLNKLKDLITPAGQALDIVLGGRITADAGKLQFVLDKYNSRKSRTK
ncbi:hypothetical protein BTO06_01105 [Tenacibaculum sp. SZ-18]|uniref:phage tail length tape measure family protein n=1 Tax=Tenacibaculum sp. SZ-18 TaxID=754423 RepID=UPI000C2D5869|nr:phage tail length tape measure family protein [Tenacibaculum sp. SZ-18]AUC13832.1 hypothetical protein BTO06_01105 [Tenacibaculum sp. SZ-18]